MGRVKGTQHGPDVLVCDILEAKALRDALGLVKVKQREHVHGLSRLHISLRLPWYEHHHTKLYPFTHCPPKVFATTVLSPDTRTATGGNITTTTKAHDTTVSVTGATHEPCFHSIQILMLT